MGTDWESILGASGADLADAYGRVAWLSALRERCVLAHELEHVWAGDIDCGNQIRLIRQERRADLAAARKLIAISDLAEVAQWASDILTAAAELHVTERLLEVRLDDLRGEG